MTYNFSGSCFHVEWGKKCVFESIIDLYVTVRGFSFASSILERYKKAEKSHTESKNTQAIYQIV